MCTVDRTLALEQPIPKAQAAADADRATPATSRRQRLGSAARCALRWAWTALIFSFVLRACLLLAVAVFVIAPHNDFGMFFYAAYNAMNGGDLYAWTATFNLDVPGWLTLTREPMYIDILNLNPPHFHVLFVPLAQLRSETAYAVWLGVSAWCLLVSLRLLNTATGAQWQGTARELALLFFVSSEMTLEMVANGQVTWVMMLPLTLMWLAYRKEHWTKVGIWFGILSAIKPFFLIFAPYFVLKGNWRVLWTSVLAAAGCCALGAAVFGVDSYRLWLTSLHESERWSWWPNNASLWSALFMRSFSATPFFEPLAEVPLPILKLSWLLVGGCMGLLTLAAAVWDRGPQAVDRAFALLLVVMLLLSPLGWVYYYWFPMVPLAAVLQRWRQEGKFAEPHRSWHAWLLGFTLLVCCVPSPMTTLFGQPCSWLTLTFANFYFWNLLLIWATLLVDSWPHVCWPRASGMSTAVQAA